MVVIATGECYHVLQSDTGKIRIEGIGWNHSDIWRYITAEEAARFADFHEPPTPDHDHALVDQRCREILWEFYDKNRL